MFNHALIERNFNVPVRYDACPTVANIYDIQLFVGYSIENLNLSKNIMQIEIDIIIQIKKNKENCMKTCRCIDNYCTPTNGFATLRPESNSREGSFFFFLIELTLATVSRSELTT